MSNIRHLSLRSTAARPSGVKSRLVTLARMASLAGAATIFLASPARPLEVAPITVEMPPGQKSATLTLTNREQAAVAVQIRVFGWDQAGGGDNLTATKDLQVSPPIF